MRATRWVMMVAVGFLAGCGGELAIVHGLEEFEANEILVVLEAKDITGVKVVEEGRVVTWSVVVPQIDAKDAMKLLVANRLPKARSSSFATVYPPGGGGLIPTKSEEKAKYMMAVQGEIERKLKSMPGIVQAHVSVVSPDKDIVRDLDTPPPPPTASVAIVYNALDKARGTAAVQEDEVQKLVASSIEDLKPANVMVVMKRNTPMKLEDEYAESGDNTATVAAARQFGLGFSDKKSATRVTVYGIVGLLIGIICLAVGVGGIVRAMSLSRRVSRAEAELTSQRKAARRDTQTGLQQQ